jgi:hypothetical protein
MTFAEAKDQVAKTKANPGRNRNYYNFEDLCECVINGWVNAQTLIDCTNEAGLLLEQHAASVREEAVKAIEELGTICHDPKNPMWDALPDSAEAVNAAYANAWNKFRQIAIEKLTAPGR